MGCKRKIDFSVSSRYLDIWCSYWLTFRESETWWWPEAICLGYNSSETRDGITRVDTAWIIQLFLYGLSKLAIAHLSVSENNLKVACWKPQTIYLHKFN